MKPLPILGAFVATGVGAAALAVACHWLGPPGAEMKESYSGEEGSGTVDHSLLDAVMARYVDNRGFVFYQRLQQDRETLDGYVEALTRVDFEKLGRNEKLALLINAYNAFTLALILDHWPLESIKDIPEGGRWKDKRWRIGSLRLSLDEIEHEYLRGRFRDPRIHFAINCASVGCPPLRREAYRAKDIEKQLQEQTKRVHRREQWFDLDAQHGTLRLTKLYDWFGHDFAEVAGSVLEFAARFDDTLARLLRNGRQPKIRWIPYDWSINAAR